MKRFFQKFTLVLSVFCMALLGVTGWLGHTLPGRFSLSRQGSVTLPTQLPMVLTTHSENSTTATVRLFGIFPVAEPAVELSGETYVVPGGTPFGIKIFADGVLIIGTGSVTTPQGSQNPARQAGIRQGDLISKVNGYTVNTNAALQKLVAASGGKALRLQVRREGKTFGAEITPVKDKAGVYRLGLWVRDSTAGLGTLTFYDPVTGVYGGLGHGVCDADTGELMPILSGEILSATVVGIKKATAGTAGELKGMLNDSKKLGTLAINTATGVYGVLNSVPTGQTVRVARKQEVQTGAATLLCSVDGHTRSYTCKITRVHLENKEHKDMVIKITDDRLLTAAGGIVQGLSGSPILQNGTLVGAVTHVFVNDPQKGYAIFAETMWETAQGVANENKLKEAS